VTSKNYEICAK